MPRSYSTLAAEARYEPPPIKGSRFVAAVAPATSEEDAARFVARIEREFDGASHVCWAMRLGPGGEHVRSSDAGEPGGSAGLPILRQLEGHGITAAVAVVVRYFGGVKLGVGGLMRAYGGAAGQCLDRARRVGVLVTRPMLVEHPYECSGAVQTILARAGLVPRSAEYGERVLLRLEVPVEEFEGLRETLAEGSGGRVEVHRPPPEE